MNHSTLRSIILRGAAGAALMAAPIALLGAPAQADPGSVHATPAAVHAGDAVTITGSCDPDTGGFAMSAAFPDSLPDHDYAGVGAVQFSTDATGAFSAVATIDPSLAPGDYSVSVRCGGGLLGVTANVHVTTKPAAVTPKPAPTKNPDVPVVHAPVFTG